MEGSHRDCTFWRGLRNPCGHQWPREETAGAARIVRDAHSNVLTAGDTVALIKNPKLGSGSQGLKSRTKAKNLRLVDGDPEIDCRIEGVSIALKACFVKKA